MEPPQPQELCERALRVWLTRLPAMPESWLPGGNVDEVDQLRRLEENVGSPVPPRVIEAAHGLAVQLARARAVARVATVSRACRALAEAALPASARAALSNKKAALVGLVRSAYFEGVLSETAVQDAVVVLHAAGAAPPTVPETTAGADEATRWEALADAVGRLLRELRASAAEQLAERAMARAAAPLGQLPPAVDHAALRQAQVGRFLALLAGADAAARA